MMLELSFGVYSFNKYTEHLLLSACLCMKVNGHFLSGGKCMYVEQHNVLRELSRF